MTFQINKHQTWRAMAAASALLLGAGFAAIAAESDSLLAPWLGKEITIRVSSQNEHMPQGGKFTLVYDTDDDVVRMCTRSVTAQKARWKMDFAVPCNVALRFVKGERYCSLEDVNAGNAEVLASCHRLRSRDVAMHPAAIKGAVELHDLIVFPLASDGEKRPSVAMMLDSPAHLTHNGIIHATL
jgi:hypothetical protein